MSLTREQLMATREHIRAHGRVTMHDVAVLLDALDEAEATITGLREALRVASATIDAARLPYGAWLNWESIRDHALARPEFPDTERGEQVQR